MQVNLIPGRYIVAVSGGVDSIVLLDLLRRVMVEQRLELTVAHFDHGIRDDSNDDRQFVQQLAESYKIPFAYQRAELGKEASEQMARNHRYSFLHKLQQAQHAEAIITAHHQDDVLETVVLNIMRGTGRKGLTSLASRAGLLRPLLDYSKQDILAYAQKQQLLWHEDSTNSDKRYRRNYIRHTILPRLDPATRDALISIINKQRITNQAIDNEIINQLHLQDKAATISRAYFNTLPHEVSKEVLATWLREQGLRSFDAPALERLATGLRVAKTSKRLDVFGGHYILIRRDDLALAVYER